MKRNRHTNGTCATCRWREMDNSMNIVTLAKILRGVIRGMHDAAPDHCQCPLQGTDACFGNSDALNQLKTIIGK